MKCFAQMSALRCGSKDLLNEKFLGQCKEVVWIAQRSKKIERTNGPRIIKYD